MKAYGPNGKLLCFKHTKNYTEQAWQHSIHVWLGTYWTKELHDLSLINDISKVFRKPVFKKSNLWAKLSVNLVNIIDIARRQKRLLKKNLKNFEIWVPDFFIIDALAEASERPNDISNQMLNKDDDDYTSEQKMKMKTSAC